MFSLTARNKRLRKLNQIKTKTATKNVLFYDATFEAYYCHKLGLVGDRIGWKYLHRPTGPALTIFDKNMHTLKWLFGGELHRMGGPAIYNNTGDELWFKHDKSHRLNGPATIHAFREPTKRWEVDGKLERMDGPASILYYNDGKVMVETWHVPNKTLIRCYGPTGFLEVERRYTRSGEWVGDRGKSSILHESSYEFKYMIEEAFTNEHWTRIWFNKRSIWIISEKSLEEYTKIHTKNKKRKLDCLSACSVL